jgi:heme A synthase
MRTTTSRSFRLLASATAAAVYLLSVVGGLVRVTGSGLGCPDWPLCHGGLLPPLHTAAIIEFSHRLVAALSGVLILSTFTIAWLRWRDHHWIVGPVSVSVGLLIVQIPLGGLVVATELEPLIVAFHLGMAMLILAGLLVAAVAAYRPPADALPLRAPRSRRYHALLFTTLGMLFILLLTGAVVVGSNAQLACPDWPLCHGGLLPPPNASPLIAVHLVHRYTVVLVSLLVVAVIVTSLRRSAALPVLRTWAVVLGVLFAVQVAIGAVQVLLQSPPLWRALHLAAATGVWASLVALVSVSVLHTSSRPAWGDQEAPAGTLAATPVHR